MAFAQTSSRWWYSAGKSNATMKFSHEAQRGTLIASY